MCFTLHHTKTEIPPPPSAVGKKIKIKNKLIYLLPVPRPHSVIRVAKVCFRSSTCQGHVPHINSVSQGLTP